MRTKNSTKRSPGLGGSPSRPVANWWGSRVVFGRKTGLEQSKSAKKLRGGNARAPSHPRRGAGTRNCPKEPNLFGAVPLGACLLRVPARRRRHAVQPKAGGSAHETTVGGRCSPTILVGREGKCGQEWFDAGKPRPSTRSCSTYGESCVATSHHQDGAVVRFTGREVAAQS